VLLIGGFVAVRLLRDQRRKKRKRARVDPPLAGFVQLDRSLTRRGISRAPYETLERFASRVETTDALPPARGTEVADLIRAYAILRYAGHGDSSAVEQGLVAAARSLG